MRQEAGNVQGGRRMAASFVFRSALCTQLQAPGSLLPAPRFARTLIYAAGKRRRFATEITEDVEN